eukprot:352476-Chlamydomonas_euryale.AAC.3
MRSRTTSTSSSTGAARSRGLPPPPAAPPAEHRVLGVLVDAWLVLDVLGAVGVAQRRQRLIIVPVGRADVGDHHGLGVAA